MHIPAAAAAASFLKLSRNQSDEILLVHHVPRIKVTGGKRIWKDLNITRKTHKVKRRGKPVITKGQHRTIKRKNDMHPRIHAHTRTHRGEAVGAATSIGNGVVSAKDNSSIAVGGASGGEAPPTTPNPATFSPFSGG
jgi:hypothetical protein